MIYKSPFFKWCHRVVGFSLFFPLIFYSYYSVKGQSIFSEGVFYKLEIQEEGVYRIGTDFLQQLGIDWQGLNPSQIRLYALPGGMLNQSNDSLFYTQPIALPLKIISNQDAVFDPDEYILFYVQGANKKIYNFENQTIKEETNLYSDNNYCFLTIVNNLETPLIEDGTILSQTSHEIETFNDYIYFEEEKINILNSGREWFSEPFYHLSERIFNYDFIDIVPNSSLNFDIELIYSAFAAGHFEVSISAPNHSDIFSVDFPSLPPGTYDLKAYRSLVSKTYNNIDFKNLELGIHFFTQNDLSNQGFLNFFTINYERRLVLPEQQYLNFRSFPDDTNPESTFILKTTNSNILIWDITNPLKPLNYPTTLENAQIKLTLNISTLKELLAFDPIHLPEPTFIGFIPNQDINNFDVPNLLIITAPEFFDEATRLANFRREKNDLKVEVVTTQQIYNAYSSGRQDITAIRNFVRTYYLKDNQNNLHYVLLFGDASFDYKDRLTNNLNLVPNYQSIESIRPLQTYSSDDFYGFLGIGEGIWSENPVQNHNLDIGLGRLPAQSLAEAQILVDKLISYHSQKSNLGQWRNKITLIADDGDNNIHQQQAHSLANLLENDYPNSTPSRLFVDAFPIEIVDNLGGQKRVPFLNENIKNAIQEGSLIINYTGHGSEQQWTSEDIFNTVFAQNLSNQNRLSLFLTATCEFGRYDNPNLRSGAEVGLLNSQGGAIAFLSTTRPVFSGTNFLTNRAFYKSLISNHDNPILGKLIQETKNNSISGINNRNFILLGDPSMRLNLPPNRIHIMSVNEVMVSTNDTLRALQKVKIEGLVDKPNFEGFIEATVYEKPTNLNTLGNSGNPSFNYTSIDNILFKGITESINGTFSFEFVVPKSINYVFGQGKMTFYTYDKNTFEDASGNHTFIIGASNDKLLEDVSPPNIELFLNNTDFQNGQIVSSNVLLLAFLRDENGINLTSSQIHGLKVILDSEQVFNLQQYYLPDTNSFQSGSVRLKLTGLTTGKHYLTFEASDNYNNRTSQRIDFFVSNADFDIEDFIIYPNPANNYLIFKIKHNYQGRKLIFKTTLYNLSGLKVGSIMKEIENPNETIDNIRWDLPEALSPGTYIAYSELTTNEGFVKIKVNTILINE